MNQKTEASQAPDRTALPSTRLGYALWQTQHAVERAHDKALEAVGISLTQAAALIHLSLQPGLSGAELARRLLVTPQSTATLLAQLEKKGWISRRPHALHRTVIEITVTAKGQRVLDEAVSTMEATDKCIGESLSSEQLRELSKALALCLAAAQELLR